MGALDSEISFFRNRLDTTNPANGTFFQIVTSEKLAAKYGPLIERIRATADKESRDLMKKQLPVFTPSGTFSRRAAEGLLKHSGLLQFDVDPKENPFLNTHTAPRLKDQISHLQEVAYCALSASGTGVWGVVPIAHPDRHNEHFTALAADFAGWGIVIDPVCSNVSHARFWSYDPEAWFNPNASIYSNVIASRPDTYTPAPRRHIEGDNAAKVEMIVQQIEASRTDITETYENWFAVGCALAHEFGENGRDYFHRIGQFYMGYNQTKSDRQFTYCLRMKSNRFTLGSLFEIARRYRIEYKGHRHAYNAPQSPTTPPTAQRVEPPAHCAETPTTPKPAPSALPPGYRRERYTNAETGRPFEVLLNADGYPAAWDLPDGQRATLCGMIQTNPAVSDLIAHFDLRLCE